jgi:hypothetical protein
MAYRLHNALLVRPPTSSLLFPVPTVADRCVHVATSCTHYGACCTRHRFPNGALDLHSLVVWYRAKILQTQDICEIEERVK